MLHCIIVIVSGKRPLINTPALCASNNASLSGSACHTASHVKHLHTWKALLQNVRIVSVQINKLIEHGGSLRRDPLRILPVSMVHPSAPVFAVQLIEVPIRCTAWSLLLLLLPRPSASFVSLRRHRTGRGSCVAHIH